MRRTDTSTGLRGLAALALCVLVLAPLAVPTATVAADATSRRVPGHAPTIVAAGDIACAMGRVKSASTCHQMETSRMALRLRPTAVLPLGDNQYDVGALAHFRAVYGPSWGRMRSITRPIPGNHEYGYDADKVTPTGGVGYFRYFGRRSHPLDPGCTRLCTAWYSYRLGAWHVVALDSQCVVVGGCAPGSAQYRWLRRDLR